MTGTGFSSPEVQFVPELTPRIAFREYGEGEPAVLIHGLGGMSTNWTDLMHALPLHGVAIDLPGFGHSDPLSVAPTLTGYADAVAAATSRIFPGRRVHLFGNSLGGSVALVLAQRHPELLASVTLVSPAMPEYWPRRTNYQVPVVALPVIGSKLFRRWQAFTPVQRMWGTVRVIYGEPTAVDPLRFREMVDETVRRDALPHTADTYLAAVRALLRAFLVRGNRGLWRCMAGIQAPLLVIYGRRDILVNSRLSHRVARARPGAVVALVLRAAHVSQMEFPTEVAALWHRHIGSAFRS